MKKFLFIALITFCSTNLCFSQTNDEYRNAISRMMVVSGSQTTFKTVITQTINMMKQQKSEIPQEFWDKFSEEMLNTSITDLTDMLVPIYKKHLTLAEVNQLIAFYESPVGKKFAEKIPLITQESMAVGREWGLKLGQKIVEKLKEKYN